MAVYATNAAPFARLFNGRHFIAEIKDAWAARQALQETKRELLALSDRDLSDLGLSRSDVISGNFIR
ncbi:MAG: DUF1127 domain-containing protein [Mangrovicoccus sp.]